jgi:hypothetical protein
MLFSNLFQMAFGHLTGRERFLISGKTIKSIVDEGLTDRSATLELLATKRQVNIMQYVSKIKRHFLFTGAPIFNGESYERFPKK